MIELLKSCCLFKNCEIGVLERFSKNAQIFSHDKGKLLFIHGDPAEQYYFIRSGWVKLFRETVEGTQAVVDILTSTDVFGETAIFENDLYPFSAEIVDKAEIISLPLKKLKREMETTPALAMNMMKCMARYRHQQDMEIEHRSIQNAPQRIGCFLLRLNKQKRNGALSLKLPYDKTLIAARLGMQPETFSRALSKLKEETEIKVKGSNIEITDIEKLVCYSCPSCSGEFPCHDLRIKRA